MSFFGDLVNSIGTDKAPLSTTKPHSRSTPPSMIAHTKPLPKPTLSSSTTTPQIATLKRKSDERDGKPVDKPIKPTLSTNLPANVNSRPSTPTANGIKSSTPMTASSKSMTPKSSAPLTASTTSTAPGKAPPKGSYADILARAKEAQQQRAQSQVGLIKHQPTSKEKVSKLAERRKEEQQKIKNEKDKGFQKTKAGDKPSTKKDASPVKREERPKVLKAPRPPLHAPKTSYKGTMGKASDRPRDSSSGRPAKRSRYDDYLGTDEEEDSEMEEEEDGYGYGSDESSDMEAGINELEYEEAAALKAARTDDARELAIENKLKAEKEERRKKLAAMAARKAR